MRKQEACATKFAATSAAASYTTATDHKYEQFCKCFLGNKNRKFNIFAESKTRNGAYL